jgi:hypothetical protein
VTLAACRVAQCALQRHCPAHDGSRVVSELAARASHQDMWMGESGPEIWSGRKLDK